MEENVLKKLVDYYHENSLSHAYLLETNNINECFVKLKEVVKEIFNESDDNNISNLIEQNYLPSFKVIEPSGSTIKKEQVLELKSLFSTMPIYTKENIYVIKNAEKLTDASANTLLKFIEEPEDHIIGFFITDNINNVISTIRSRCEILKVVYKTHELDLDSINNGEYSEKLDDLKKYLYSIEIDKKKSIMYNKDILLNKYKEREEYKILFKMMFIIYESVMSSKVINGFEYLCNINKVDILKRLDYINKMIEDINYNGNIELILDGFVIEVGGING